MKVMGNLIVPTLLVLVLAGCAGPASQPAVTPSSAPSVTAGETAESVPEPVPSFTLVPTAPPTSPVRVTNTVIPGPPSPVPPEPDPTVIAGWRELEQALADTLLGGPLNPSPVLCEWAYLGREGLEVYLYVHCSNTEPIQEGGDHYPGVSVPVLVVYDNHGGIQEVQAPGSGTLYPKGIRRLFPPRVQEMIFERQIDFRALSDHLALRREDPDLPPLYVLDD
jgi:hypothetical protein